MSYLRDRMAGLFEQAAFDVAPGKKMLDQFADRALDIIAEECAGLAVVEPLGRHVHVFKGGSAWFPTRPALGEPIPIAPAPPSLLERVAGMLLDRVLRDPEGHELEDTVQPPFAAAYADTQSGRTYVLVSGECEACGGDPIISVRCNSKGKTLARCRRCNGTGARADVRAIARRYGGDGDTRLARFEVKR